MRVFAALIVAAALGLTGTSGTRADRAGTHAARTGLIPRDGVAVHARPVSTAKVLTTLAQQTQVRFLSASRGWVQILFWGSLHGWIPKGDIVYRKPWPSVSTYTAPEVHYQLQRHPPTPVRARAILLQPLALHRAPGSVAVGLLPSGRRVLVSSWQQDTAGKIWYRIGSSWVLGDAVQFQIDRTGHASRGASPAWKRIAGKGMWLTLGTIAGSSPDAIVQAAQRDGMTHLYVEAAISPLGFHGRGTVGGLLSVAHHRHIAVIAWVYPYLYDVASDVRLTEEVAAFRTPTGDSFDGIAADLERNIHLWTVRAYSQLVRAALGPQYLLVGVTYPPQSFAGYPYAEVGHDYDAAAPMDYWHETKTQFGLDYGHLQYGWEYGRRYAADSIFAMRRDGLTIPIAPIGQTFDDFGRLELGPHAPSAAEIMGFLSGSKDGGAIGASFFQWMTATDSEWQAIRGFRY